MIVDSSALLAILQLEPEAERLARAIASDSSCLISAANWLETSIVVLLRVGEEGLRDLDLLAARLNIETVSVTPGQAEIARRAFRQYGKGIHPARLNYGDRFAYSLSKETGEPLLFKGDDFGKTDIVVVQYWNRSSRHCGWRLADIRCRLSAGGWRISAVGCRLAAGS